MAEPMAVTGGYRRSRNDWKNPGFANGSRIRGCSHRGKQNHLSVLYEKKDLQKTFFLLLELAGGKLRHRFEPLGRPAAPGVIWRGIWFDLFCRQFYSS